MPRNINFSAKWRGSLYEVMMDIEISTVGDLKNKLTELVAVAPGNQKIAGLTKSSLFKLSDEQLLCDIDLKENGFGVVTFMLIGTPDDEIKDNTKLDSTATKPSILVNDLSLSFGPSSKIFKRLQKHTSEVQLHFINPPRPGKKLCVLDLDKTILDFTSKDESVAVEDMKRPHLDLFLATIWEHYDIAIWSQTSWRWLELKLHELNLCNREEYSLCFCLDKTTMFRASELENEYVKPLALIFSHAPQGVRWGLDNTVHVDDLCRNFLLNQGAGITISPYQRDKRISSSEATVFEGLSAVSPTPGPKDDVELLLLARYLVDIAPLPDLTVKSHSAWREEVLRAAAGGAPPKETKKS